MNFIKILMFFLLFFSNLSSSANQSYSYTGWLMGEKYYFSDNEDLIINFGGDEPNKVTQCEPKSGYICFFSRRLAFAIPKNAPISQRTWTVNNTEFELIEKDKEVVLFGQEIKGVYLIRTPYEATLAGRHTEKDTYWLYTYDRGVIGFGFKENTRVYWLEQKIGYGSNQSKVLE